MIRKDFLEIEGQAIARVTFILPNCIWAGAVHLVGDFNGWSRTSHPLTHDRDGNWTITLDLPAGRNYEFRYLCDDDRWMNDPQADAYARSAYGNDNSVLSTTPSLPGVQGQPRQE